MYFRPSPQFSTTVFCIFSVYLLNVVTASTSHKSEQVNQADILLRIETKAGSGSNSPLQVIRAGEEDESTTTSSTTENPSLNSTEGATDIKQCDTERGCCFQFTWPGPDYDNGLYNFTCAAYARSQGRDNPCKEPVVFTVAEKENEGRRPNITELVMYCEENKCNVFCAKTSCIKYSYFRKGSGGMSLWNETRFCGTALRDGNNLENGCFKEKLSGFTREICVCNGNACNPATNLLPFFFLTYLTPALLSILYLRRSNIVYTRLVSSS